MSGKKRLALLLIPVIFGIGLFTYLQKKDVQAVFLPPLELPWTTPPDFHIVYLLTDPSAVEQSRLASSQLSKVLAARLATSWEEITALNRERPIEAVIIHESAVPLLDGDWLAKAYREGVVIATFNVDVQTLESILNTSGLAEEGFVSKPYPADFSIVVSRLALGKKEDVELVNEALDSGIEEPIVQQRNILNISGKSPRIR